MFKLLLPLFVFAIALPVLAQDRADIMRGIMIEENAYVDPDAAADAREAARKLLETQPRQLRRQNFPKLRSRQKLTTPTLDKKVQAAPFGLMWGASISETKNQGIQLTAIGEKDYVNNFSATRLPKMLADFARVDLTFGEEDELWRIIAYSVPQTDTAEAEKGLRLYRIYNDLLTQKYGHPQEFFTPAKITVEEKDAKGKTVEVQKDAPIGNPDFLSQLQKGTAVLYSTYYNDEVGAALALNVDGDGKSYIVVDYKNLKILRQREKQTLDAL